MKKKEEKIEVAKNIANMLYHEFGACFLLVEGKNIYQLWERGKEIKKNKA